MTISVVIIQMGPKISIIQRLGRYTNTIPARVSFPFKILGSTREN